MRYRRRIADRRNAYARLTYGPDRRLASAARPFYADFNLTHPRIGSLSRGLAGSLLRGERRSFSGTAKAPSSRRRLGDKVAVGIGDRDHRVVKRRSDMNDPVRNVLFLFLFVNLFLWCCHKNSCQLPVVGGQSLSTANCQPPTANYFLPGAFFLATAAFLGPFRVRALVWVRWPRTGRLRR